MINRKFWNTWMAAVGPLLMGLTTLVQGEPQRSYVPDSSLDVGKVNQGDSIEHSFVVRNPGHSKVTIELLALSHPGMKVRMPPELSPGTTGRIHVTWDTRLVQGDTTAQALLRFNEAETVFVSLSAKVIPPIEITPYPAVFISGFRDESVIRTLEIVNHDPIPLNITGISRENPESAQSYSATFTTVEPGRRHQLLVELKSAAPGGRSRDTLLVLTDHPRFAVMRVPVNLLVKDDVYINPELVDFGQITGEAWSPEAFMLKAHRGPIKVLSVTSDLPFLKVTVDGATPASTHEFKVEIEGKVARGPFSGTITIKTDDPLFAEVKAPVHGEVVK